MDFAFLELFEDVKPRVSSAEEEPDLGEVGLGVLGWVFEEDLGDIEVEWVFEEELGEIEVEMAGVGESIFDEGYDGSVVGSDLGKVYFREGWRDEENEGED